MGKNRYFPFLILLLLLILIPDRALSKEIPGLPTVIANPARGEVGFPLTPTAAWTARRLRGSAEIDS